VNNKLPLKVTLFNQNRIASPSVLNAISTLRQSFTSTPIASQHIFWRYVINQIQQKTDKQLSFDKIAIPELTNMRVAEKNVDGGTDENQLSSFCILSAY
jgi:hypothetical protein